MLVGAAFTALILAVSAQREATEREARSKDVTTASLQLEKLVSDVETSFLGFTVTRAPTSLGPTRTRAASCRHDCGVLQNSSADDPTQRAGCEGSTDQIRGYVYFFVAPLIPILLESPSPAERGLWAAADREGADGRDPADVQRVPRGREQARRRSRRRDADERTDLAVVVGAIAVGASMALITLFGIVLARSIGRPVRAAASGAEPDCGRRALAAACRRRVPARSGELTRAFNSMAERLAGRAARSWKPRTRSYARASG